MRQPTDTCLLCQTNKSTKKNSHILPRFISTKFLGPKGTNRVGYSLDDKMPVSIDENGEVVSKPAKIQDSPKENYILCDECEAYFSILETDAAPLYNSWDQKVGNSEYNKITLSDDFSVVQCLTANPFINRLLVYSMFWRASISSHKLFSNYTLNSLLEESLRTILYVYRATKKSDVTDKINQKPPLIHPYSMLTAETFQDETANVLAALNSENPASLHVDRFAFLLFENISNLKDTFHLTYANKSNTDLNLMVVSPELWLEVVVGRAIQMYAKQRIVDLTKPPE